MNKKWEFYEKNEEKAYELKTNFSKIYNKKRT